MKRTLWNSRLPAPTKPIARSQKPLKRVRVKRVNRERAASTFARGFHSDAFVQHVKYNGRCASCGVAASYERPATCSHAEARKRGSWGADWRRIFRQCPACHLRYEGRAADFCASLGYDVSIVETWIAMLHSELRIEGIVTPDELATPPHSKLRRIEAPAHTEEE